MLSHENLFRLDLLISSPIIANVGFTQYKNHSTVEIQSTKDAPEDLVVSTVEKVMCIDLVLNNSDINFDHINAYGTSYRAPIEDSYLTLITVNTRKEASAPTEAPIENTLLDNTTVWTAEQILINEG